MKINKSIETRIAELEALITKNLTAIITYSNGDKKRLNVVDIVFAAIDNEPQIATIEWLNADNGRNGVLPQLAEFLIGADYQRNIDGKG